MSHRSAAQTFPEAPSDWDAPSKAAWARLIQVLATSDLFDRGRRTRPQFIVAGTVSAPVTIDVNAPDLTALTHTVAKLLIALQGSHAVDVR